MKGEASYSEVTTGCVVTMVINVTIVTIVMMVVQSGKVVKGEASYSEVTTGCERGNPSVASITMHNTIPFIHTSLLLLTMRVLRTAGGQRMERVRG